MGIIPKNTAYGNNNSRARRIPSDLITRYLKWRIKLDSLVWHLCRPEPWEPITLGYIVQEKIEELHKLRPPKGYKTWLHLGKAIGESGRHHQIEVDGSLKRDAVGDWCRTDKTVMH